MNAVYRIINLFDLSWDQSQPQSACLEPELDCQVNDTVRYADELPGRGLNPVALSRTEKFQSKQNSVEPFSVRRTPTLIRHSLDVASNSSSSDLIIHANSNRQGFERKAPCLYTGQPEQQRLF